MRPQYVGLKTCRNRPSGLPDNVSGAAGKIIDVLIGHIRRQLDLLSVRFIPQHGVPLRNLVQYAILYDLMVLLHANP